MCGALYIVHMRQTCFRLLKPQSLIASSIQIPICLFPRFISSFYLLILFPHLFPHSISSFYLLILFPHSSSSFYLLILSHHYISSFYVLIMFPHSISSFCLCCVLCFLRPWTTFSPLALVLGVSLLKEAMEDYSRHTADNETNNRTVQLLKPNGQGFEPCTWQKVRAQKTFPLPRHVTVQDESCRS